MLFKRNIRVCIVWLFLCVINFTSIVSSEFIINDTVLSAFPDLETESYTILHAHIGNDLPGILFLFEPVELSSPEELTLGGETITCSRQLQGLYSIGTKGAILRPIDSNSLSQLATASNTYLSMSLSGGLFTGCTGIASAGEQYVYGAGYFDHGNAQGMLAAGLGIAIESNSHTNTFSGTLLLNTDNTISGRLYDNADGLIETQNSFSYQSTIQTSQSSTASSVKKKGIVNHAYTSSDPQPDNEDIQNTSIPDDEGPIPTSLQDTTPEVITQEDEYQDAVCNYADGDFASYKSTFTDIQNNEYYEPVAKMLDYCLIHGVEYGKRYGIGNNLTLGESYKIFSRLMLYPVEYTNTDKHRSEGYYNAGIRYGMRGESGQDPEELITINQVVELSAQYLKKQGIISPDRKPKKKYTGNIKRGDFAKLIAGILAIVENRLLYAE